MSNKDQENMQDQEEENHRSETSNLQNHQNSHNELLISQDNLSPSQLIAKGQNFQQKDMELIGGGALGGMAIEAHLEGSQHSKYQKLKKNDDSKRDEPHHQRSKLKTISNNSFNVDLNHPSPIKTPISVDNPFLNGHVRDKTREGGPQQEINHRPQDFLANQASSKYRIKLQKQEKQNEIPVNQKQKQWKCCNFLRSTIQPIVETLDLDQISNKISVELERQRQAEKNWKRVRIMKYRIIALGKVKRLLIDNRMIRDGNGRRLHRQFIIMPDSLIKILFDIFVNSAYVISFLLIPYIIAFDIRPLEREHLRWVEFAIDWVILSNIIVQFFTAHQNDADIVINLRQIAKKYLFSFFIFDILSCIPGIVTVERPIWPYYFKVARYMQVTRLFEQVQLIQKKIKVYFIDNQEAFDNFFKLLKTLFYLTMLFHILGSIWILVGSTENGWIDNIPDDDDKNSELFMYLYLKIILMCIFSYVTAIYFVVTTATTVGYGDYYAYNSREKVYMIFLEFSAICIFSLITGNITSLKSIKKISEILDKKVNFKNIQYLYKSEDIENYLCQIDISIMDKEIDSKTYDKAIEYIKNSYLKGVTQSLRDGDFYKMLPPQLKTDLINEVLKDYHQQFYFFFHDIQNKNHADNLFIRKVLSNLDCQIFLPMAEIIEAGDIVNKLYFCQKGSILVSSSFQDTLRTLPIELQMEVRKSVLESVVGSQQNTNGQQQQRTQNNENLILKSSILPPIYKKPSSISSVQSPVTYITILPQGSFFGDYQILFNLPSNYTFQSFSNEETICMSIPSEKFLSICENFPKFHSFLCQRALMRRNHFKMQERYAKEAAAESRNRKRVLETEGEMVESKSKKKATDIANHRDRTKLLDPELLDLSFLETPKFKSDLEYISVNFRIPIIRMYIQGISQVSWKNQKQIHTNFQKFDDFFNVVSYVINGEDLQMVMKELTFHKSKSEGKKILEGKNEDQQSRRKKAKDQMFSELESLGRDQARTAQIGKRPIKPNQKSSVVSLPPIESSNLSNGINSPLKKNFAPDQL